MEIYKSVVGYEGLYSVSNFGMVKSESRIVTTTDGRTYPKDGCKLSVSSKKRYKMVNLYQGSKRVTYLVHRLVAEAFIPNPLNLPQVNHKDGNRHNNCVANLEWCTSKENISHAYITGLSTTGTDHHKSKITEVIARNICTLLSSGIMPKEVAHLTDVSVDTIAKIKAKKTWKKVSKDFHW